MPDNEYLKTILNTFDISNERKEKLFSWFSHRLDNFYSDIDLYRYVTDLVLNKHNTPTNFIRLDQPIKYDSNGLFHDVVGTLDNNLESLLNETNERDDKLTINEALSILKNELDSLDYTILGQLMPQNLETKLNLNYENLIKNIPQIQKRIEIFSNNDGGNIIMSKRPIIRVKFTDENYKIIYGKRNFNKNPLIYFLENYNNKRLTRTELYNIDKSLYDSLYRYIQMDLAIPTTLHRNFNGDPLDFFKKKYKNRKISRYELQQEDDGLYRVLLDRELLDEAIPEKKVNGSQPRYTSKEDTKKILELYYRFNSNVCQASKNSQFSWDVLTKYWKNLGLKITNHRIKSDEEINEIINLYRIYEGSARRASSNTHHSHSTITKYWKRAGLKTRNPGQRTKLL